jgi:hypothetical protein
MNKIKKQSKKNKRNIIRIIWLTLGLLIIIWNIYWFVKVNIQHDYGIVGNVIKYNLGIFALILYILINLIISLIKKFKEYKSLKHNHYN